MINTVSRRAIPDFRALVSCNSTVKRCLFGEPDHKLVREELDKELKTIRNNDAQRWNFDFRAEEPLPGNFEWEKMSTHVFAQTRSTTLATPSKDFEATTSNTASSTSATTTVNTTAKSEPPMVPLMTCTSPKPTLTQKRKAMTSSQCSITKYFKVSKRITRSSLGKNRDENERTPSTRATRRNLNNKVC